MKTKTIEKTVFVASDDTEFTCRKDCVGYELEEESIKTTGHSRVKGLASMAKKAVAILSQLLPEDDKIEDEIYTRIDHDDLDGVVISYHDSSTWARRVSSPRSSSVVLRNGKPCFVAVLDETCSTGTGYIWTRS